MKCLNQAYLQDGRYVPHLTPQAPRGVQVSSSATMLPWCMVLATPIQTRLHSPRFPTRVAAHTSDIQGPYSRVIASAIWVRQIGAELVFYG